MAEMAARIRLGVLGPADLLVTALVAGFGSLGVDAERVSSSGVPGVRSTPPGTGLRVLLVDVDRNEAIAEVLTAVEAGLTVIAIGSDRNRERAAAAIAAGAVEWVRKSASLEALAETVRGAAAGRLRVSEAERAAWLAEHRTATDTVRAEMDRLIRLSPREREVLRLLAEGRRAAEVSAQLFLAITTVRSHIRSILVKLGVHSQQQAVDVYRRASRLARSTGTRPNL